MGFHRTNSGISNKPLLFGLHVIVYLEGGKKLKYDNVQEGNYHSSTEDIGYWQTLFDVYFPKEIKFEFRSIGSKRNIENMIPDVESGEIENTILAMDRDFDNITERLKKSKNILYTCGYSWENDAWNKESVKEVLKSLSTTCRTQLIEANHIIDEYYDECSLKLEKAVYIDAMLLSQGKPSFFDHGNYRKYIGNNNNIPSIDQTIIDEEMSSVGEYADNYKFEVSVLQDCFGHLFSELGYQILKHLLEKNDTLQKSAISSFIIAQFGGLLKDGELPYLDQHYRTEFSRIEL